MYFVDCVCSVLGKSWLESPEEAWVLIGTQRSLNCTFTGGAAVNTAMHWYKDGKKINNIGNQFLKEIKVSEKIIQLKFVNATLSDAGIYHCMTKTGTGKILNSSSVIHIGSKYCTEVMFSKVFALPTTVMRVNIHM